MRTNSAPRREITSSFIHPVATLSLSLIFTACGQLPGFTVDAVTKNFVQEPVLNDKIDILFVVDNSGSMLDEQVNLANSFESFINEFATKNLKFQVGVISTDVVNNANWWAATGAYVNSSPYKFILNNGPGTLLAKTGNDKILTPESVDYIDQFQDNVQLGVTGSGSEAGILSAIKFFDPANMTEGGWNADFVREEAFLAVIFVSDEDEGWGISGTSGITAATYIRTLTGGQKEERLEEFSNIVKSVKPDREDLIRVDSIIAPSLAECPTVGIPNGVPGTGEVYKEVAALFGGTVTNICSDFSDELAAIGTNLITVLTRFKLVQKPLGQIEVEVDGVVVPRDSENGWEYLAETQEVEFRGSAIPDANASIAVRYVPGEPLQ